MSTPPIEVAAGYLACADSGARLFTQRPAHKVRGGYWELPGGKIEPGEDPLAALRRELIEELGTAPTDARLLFRIRHQYQDVAVRLHVFDACIQRSALRPDPRSVADHQWLNMNSIAGFSAQICAADRKVLRRLLLPAQLTISADCVPGDESRWLDTCAHLAPAWLLLRTPSLAQAQARALVLRARAALGSHATLSVSADVDFAIGEGLGVHLRAAQLASEAIGLRVRAHWGNGAHRGHRAHRGNQAQAQSYLGASTHGAAELLQAESIGADYATLSPVLATASHPGARFLGWPEFARIAAQTELPLLALGGMAATDLGTAQHFGAHGLAGIRGFWAEQGFRCGSAKSKFPASE